MSRAQAETLNGRADAEPGSCGLPWPLDFSWSVVDEANFGVGASRKADTGQT